MFINFLCPLIYLYFMPMLSLLINFVNFYFYIHDKYSYFYVYYFLVFFMLIKFMLIFLLIDLFVFMPINQC